MSHIKDHYKKDMSLADAEKLSLQILKNVMEDAIDKDCCEMVVIRTSD